jgi:hypothetical protein
MLILRTLLIALTQPKHGQRKSWGTQRQFWLQTLVCNTWFCVYVCMYVWVGVCECDTFDTKYWQPIILGQWPFRLCFQGIPSFNLIQEMECCDACVTWLFLCINASIFFKPYPLSFKCNWTFLTVWVWFIYVNMWSVWIFNHTYIAWY